MKKKRFVTNSGVVLVERDTGELLSAKREVRVEDIDVFLNVYLSSLGRMAKELSGVEMRVLIEAWKHSTFNDYGEIDGNIVHNDAMFKGRVAAECGLDAYSVNNAVSRLAKKGFLIKKFKGCYLLNPEYFWKGSLRDRSRVMLTVTYGGVAGTDNDFTVVDAEI